MSYYPLNGFLEAIASGKQTPGEEPMRVIAAELLQLRKMCLAQQLLLDGKSQDRLRALSQDESHPPGLADWVWKLQMALPDNLEDLLPREIRCPWCDNRFSGAYHDKGCPVREAAP